MRNAKNEQQQKCKENEPKLPQEESKEQIIEFFFFFLFQIFHKILIIWLFHSWRNAC